MGTSDPQVIEQVKSPPSLSPPEEATDLSVVIPTVGRMELLRNCLSSIASGRMIPRQVLLGDQSHDSSVTDLAAEMSSQLPIRVVASNGAGIARNMNQLFSATETELVLVTHDDCRVDQQWVQRGRNALLASPGALVTGKVLPGAGKSHSVPSTIVRDEAEDLTNSLLPGRLYPANMGSYRSAVLELGGFDERAGFRRAAEDLDFAYRWLRNGRPMHYVPSMVVVHEDWRAQAELARLHRAYARAGGRFFGKYLYKGDRHAARMASNDVMTGIKAWRERLLSGSQLTSDPRLARPLWIPVGIVEGLYESWRLSLKRARPPAPD